MRVEHRLIVTALCPLDGVTDVYALIIRARHVVPVEDIRALVATCAGEQLFQENLTERLHRALACEVETIGYHSGVRTCVVCGLNTEIEECR